MPSLPPPPRGNSFHLFFSPLFTCFFSHISGHFVQYPLFHIFREKQFVFLSFPAITDINLPPRVSTVSLLYHYFCNAHFAMETYFWKRHICTICSWPPFCHLDSSRRSLRWRSLVRHPINSGERIEVVSISPRLHCAYCKILCIDSFGPRCDSMVHCDGVIQVHVTKGDLYLNLFVRIEAVWWEYHWKAFDCILSFKNQIIHNFELTLSTIVYCSGLFFTRITSSTAVVMNIQRRLWSRNRLCFDL